MRGFGLEIADMRQRLIEPLDDDVQPVGGSAIGHFGADAGKRPDRRHHGHFVLHRVEDDDQRRPHENAVWKVKRVRLGRGQMLDEALPCRSPYNRKCRQPSAAAPAEARSPTSASNALSDCSAGCGEGAKPSRRLAAHD